MAPKPPHGGKPRKPRVREIIEPPPPPAPEPIRRERSSLHRHVRRYGPMYALAAIAGLVFVLFPTSRQERVTQTGPSGSTGGTGTQGGGSQTGSGATNTRLPGLATGRTQQNASCAPGIRQMPWSQYATQCQAKFTGSNGGETSRGVDADTITILRRTFPETANSQAVAAFGAQAGAAAPEVTAEVRDVFLDYFNETFELYGRRVEIKELEANPVANATLEVQGRGKEGACIDATKAAEEIKAFGVLDGSGPFSECAADRQLVVFNGGAYFPESWYQRYDPYVWHQVMDCERISYQVAEYVGKRLAGRKATWAGDAALQARTRTFGTYVPNNDEYQHCVSITEKTLLDQYKTKIASRYNYTLDISRFPDETVRGVVQFKAAGVTTLINANDPISTTFLSQAATRQRWYPEWFIIGVAAQDTDAIARLFDQKQVDGHLFGMSQLDEQHRLWGAQSEPGITYKRITGKDIPSGTTGDYFQLVQVFNFLQSAGPNLTPQTMAAGVRAMPAGGAPDFAIGYVSYSDAPDGTAGGTDHTGIDDSREVYWCGTCASALDGKPGAYLETYAGKRFRNGEWPSEEPPVYPR